MIAALRSSRLFRSLHHRNFRLYFVGQALSLVGTWTQSTTMNWMVDRLTQSAGMQGIVGSLTQLPALLLPPFAGVITDRFDRKHLVITTQSLAMLQAFALAALVAFTQVSVWEIVLCNFILSAINAFDMPARQTLIGDMLDNREDLANAIAVNSSVVNGARLIGPSLAAMLIVVTGEAGGFFVNGLSFIAVICCLAAMRIQRAPRPKTVDPLWQQLREGWSYVSAPGPIRGVLLVVASVCLFGLPYSLLLPRLTHLYFDGTPGTYAVLMTAPGLGAFAAGVFVVWRGMKSITIRIAIAPVIAGLCMIGISMAKNLAVASCLLFGSGFGFLILLNSANILLQTISDPSKRGRVMSFYTIAFLGMAPLGNLLVPGMAEWLGIPRAMQVSGVACCLTGVFFGMNWAKFRAEIRRRLAADNAERTSLAPTDSAVSTTAVIPIVRSDLPKEN